MLSVHDQEEKGFESILGKGENAGFRSLCFASTLKGWVV